jgi:Fur family transcriptional regulator, ferric uptake regulator
LNSKADIEHSLEEQCAARGMRMTDQRRIIAQIIQKASDHPDVEELYRRASAIDAGISLSTVYRTLNLFEEAGLVTKHDFRDGRARFEPIPDEHHDHLIDIRSGKVIEFRNEEIEAIQEVIARRLGYKLVDHRLELYAVPLDNAPEKNAPGDISSDQPAPNKILQKE